MLIAFLPTSGIQNPGQYFPKFLDFNKFPLTEVSNLYMLFLKTLICKNGKSEYQVKMEDTNYDAKIFGRRTRVRMNESQ